MSTRTARALWFVGEKELEIRSEKIEKKRGEILVRSVLSGISHGTELLFFRNQLPEGLETDVSIKSLSGRLEYPIKYGYINVGKTEKEKKVFGFFPHQDFFSAPEDELIPIPEEMSFEDAVFLAHTETALNIVQDASLIPGDNVLVLGQGTIGLLTAEILTRSLPALVITADAYKIRRRASEKIGCTTLRSDDHDFIDNIYALTEGRGADCIINVSGSERALQVAIDSAAFEGTIIEASWYGSKTIKLRLGEAFHRKRLKLKSSQVSNINSSISTRWNKKRRYSFALRLIEMIHPSKYITHRFKFGDSQRAFELLDTESEKTIQVILEP